MKLKKKKLKKKNEEKQIVKQPVSVADDDETDFKKTEQSVFLLCKKYWINFILVVDFGRVVV